MKTGLFAAVAALTLSAASAVSAATVATYNVMTFGGSGATVFTLADSDDYTFTVGAPGFTLSLYSILSPTSAIASGASPLYMPGLSAGTYAAILSNPAYTDTSVSLTVTTEDVVTPAVPLPATAPLLALALGGAGLAARRKARKAA